MALQVPKTTALAIPGIILRFMAMKLLIFLISLAWAALGREWHGVEADGTLEAEFAGMKDEKVLLRMEGGRSLVLPLRLLSREDQEFARLAQVSLNGAQVLGPQTFEVQCVVDGGCMARMGTRLQGGKGPWLFIGETFFLPMGGQKLERGDRLESKLLYYAGNRTYQPLEGDAVVLRAFALDLDDAVNADLRIRLTAAGDPTKFAPTVLEPLVERVSTRAIALPVGKGLFISEAAPLKDARTLVLHQEGKDLPVKVLKKDDALGMVLISCAHEMEPLRLLPREPLQIGQNVYAVSIPLTGIRKKLATPILTRGIVSKTGSAQVFQHDASVARDAIGGYLLNDRWEVAGVFFRPTSRMETTGTGKKPASAAAEAPPALLECLHSRALEKLFIEGEKDKPRRMSGVPPLRSGSLGEEAAEVIARLRKGTALLVATHEVMRTPPPRKDAAAGAAGQPAGAAQFSLSGSGTRHNARCRWFNPAKACQANEGSPCKACGG